MLVLLYERKLDEDDWQKWHRFLQNGMWRYNPSGTPGAGGEWSAGIASRATCSRVQTENGG